MMCGLIFGLVSLWVRHALPLCVSPRVVRRSGCVVRLHVASLQWAMAPTQRRSDATRDARSVNLSAHAVTTHQASVGGPDLPSAADELSEA